MPKTLGSDAFEDFHGNTFDVHILILTHMGLFTFYFDHLVAVPHNDTRRVVALVNPDPPEASRALGLLKEADSDGDDVFSDMMVAFLEAVGSNKVVVDLRPYMDPIPDKDIG